MIVDAYNQFIRGYIVDPSKNPNGQPIGGMRTFINILNKITREVKPDMVVVVWDGKDHPRVLRLHPLCQQPESRAASDRAARRIQRDDLTYGIAAVG